MVSSSSSNQHHQKLQQQYMNSTSKGGQVQALEEVIDKVSAMISKERQYSIDLVPAQNSNVSVMPSSPTTVIDLDDHRDHIHKSLSSTISKKLTSNICREVCQWMYKVRGKTETILIFYLIFSPH